MLMLALGCDHGGYQLKEFLKKHLEKKGIEVKDFGTYSEDSVDYPVYAEKVAKAVQSGEAEGGILCCGTGIGISIAANKFDGIRCALVRDSFSARLTKEHNNANIIALGGRVTGTELAADIVDSWMNAEFQGGRHQGRIDIISSFEK
ncbi:MAG: ribose 5-phosphate isomerase B [Clostridia bacterium]|nr:ribose 5-phosphate isomerase B [Clostridia bacterium]